MTRKSGIRAPYATTTNARAINSFMAAMSTLLVARLLQTRFARLRSCNACIREPRSERERVTSDERLRLNGHRRAG